MAASAVASELGVVDAGHVVAPLEDLATILFGHPHQLRDRLKWELGRDVLHEVTRAALDHVVDDSSCLERQVLLEQMQGTRSEALADDPTVTGVIRTVHPGKHLLHHRPLEILGVDVYEREAQPTHEKLRFPARQLNVGLLGQAPEPRPCAVCVPVHRVLVAQDLEGAVVALVAEHVGAEQLRVVQLRVGSEIEPDVHRLAPLSVVTKSSGSKCIVLSQYHLEVWGSWVTISPPAARK